MQLDDAMIDTLRTRPGHVSWQEEACHAVMGLMGEAARLVAGVDRHDRVVTELALAGVWTYQQLVAYQLDVRVEECMSDGGHDTLRQAALDVLQQAGSLASITDGWLYRGEHLDPARTRHVLRALDRARASMRVLLFVERTMELRVPQPRQPFMATLATA